MSGTSNNVPGRGSCGFGVGGRGRGRGSKITVLYCTWSEGCDDQGEVPRPGQGRWKVLIEQADRLVGDECVDETGVRNGD
ncbi:hypothetical protein BofuT4_uP162750.1 [Botrytis cinerea T4]|uniref:Uncharacterized protein n=1 Tax=Botryotinia fuckeliana (strain T4) TaxID=999810 RepID=G2YT82_BOTF4|nr:hypothetical protein BofuT4_uP162750.1 [Botrytis cinerea T4]